MVTKLNELNGLNELNKLNGLNELNKLNGLNGCGNCDWPTEGPRNRFSGFRSPSLVWSGKLVRLATGENR